MWWLVGVGLALVVVGVVLMTRRDQVMLDEMSSLVLEGRHAEVLAHPLPSRLSRRTGQAVQATSAVLTGRFALALKLLGRRQRPVRGFPDQPIDEMVRGAALMGLGRYEEAAQLLGDDPDNAELRRLRAQAAIEVGDDRLAERLLTKRDSDHLGEAGRRRVLGDLLLRRGRSGEGAVLVRDARLMYSALDDPGVDVDEAYCSVLLGRAELRGGDPGRALDLLATGKRALAKRADNAPGLAEVHALLAEAHAALGDRAAAAEHMAAASEQARRCESPALDATIARASAMVALRLGQRTGARDLLLDALRRHEALGAQPAADELRAELAALSD